MRIYNGTVGKNNGLIWLIIALSDISKRQMIPKNPYIIGNPVGNTQAFVGRSEVLRAVLRVLKHPQNNAIVLFGQRRIGKSSLLHQLRANLLKEGYYSPIFFDLQDKAQWPIERVLRDFARKISDELQQQEPDLGEFPEKTFKADWLPTLLNKLPHEKSLVLLFDEFDVLDNPETGQQAGQAFFPYLRVLLDIDHQRLNFVFVLGRNIDDMSNIALNLFKGATYKRVSLLSREDTFELIRLTESESNQTLLWTDDAIKKIWQLTHGHPYLTQHLCSRVWDNIYDNNPEKVPPTATLKEVEEQIESAEILEASRNALEWLWAGLPTAEKFVASVLADEGAKPITEHQLKQLLHEKGVRLITSQLQKAPNNLIEWDLIELGKEGYRFRVELLRRWVVEYKSPSRMQEKLEREQNTYPNYPKWHEPIDWHIITSSKGGIGQTLLALLLLAHNLEYKGNASTLVIDLNKVNTEFSRLLFYRKEVGETIAIATPEGKQIVLQKTFSLGEEESVYYVVGWPLNPFRIYDPLLFANLLASIKNSAKIIEEKLDIPPLKTVVIDTGYHFCNIFSEQDTQYSEYTEGALYGDSITLWFMWVYRQLENLIRVKYNDATVLKLTAAAIERNLKSNLCRTTPFMHVFGAEALISSQQFQQPQKLQTKPEDGIWSFIAWIFKKYRKIFYIPLKELEVLENLPIGNGIGFDDWLKRLDSAHTAAEKRGDPRRHFLDLLTKAMMDNPSGQIRPKNVIPLSIYHEGLQYYSDDNSIDIIGDLRHFYIYKNFSKLMKALVQQKA
jgi:hypothetical protein